MCVDDYENLQSPPVAPSLTPHLWLSVVNPSSPVTRSIHGCLHILRSKRLKTRSLCIGSTISVFLLCIFGQWKTGEIGDVNVMNIVLANWPCCGLFSSKVAADDFLYKAILIFPCMYIQVVGQKADISKNPNIWWPACWMRSRALEKQG